MIFFPICLLLVASTSDVRAQTAPTSEYQLKAVFLFNFAQFVEWPPPAFPETKTPFIVGVLGDDPFGAYLNETVRGETVQTHPMIVRRYRDVADIEACHILFISRSEADRMEPVLTSLHGQGTLTVSDAESFAEQGGMIQFVTEANKIRLRINVEAARAADLTISSKLLSLAQIVTPRGS